MIVAILLADRVPPAGAESPYLVKSGDQTAIERAAGTILRGPFGGTVVASAPQHAPKIREALAGFAVQHLQLRSGSGRPHAALIEAITFAQAFRARWEKAMAAAKARFGADENDDDDGPSAKSASKGKPADWSKHRKSGDVKVRGLARSFDRDGIILFRAENPDITPELQAQLVEAFGREAADKGAAARPFAQAVHQGRRGYPVLLSLPAAAEVAALPPETDFDAWLLQNVERVQDVPV